MAALAKRLMHVCVTVPNLDEALEFYRNVLGFESVFETENEKADGQLLGFDAEEVGLKAHHMLAVGENPGQATEINLVEYTDPQALDAGPDLQMILHGLEHDRRG
jgi:catechol 2,3-dioxygenase-like lactoylglutathione lyase family enzyme